MFVICHYHQTVGDATQQHDIGLTWSSRAWLTFDSFSNYIFIVLSLFPTNQYSRSTLNEGPQPGMVTMMSGPEGKRLEVSRGGAALLSNRHNNPAMQSLLHTSPGSGSGEQLQLRVTGPGAGFGSTSLLGGPGPSGVRKYSGSGGSPGGWPGGMRGSPSSVTFT